MFLCVLAIRPFELPVAGVVVPLVPVLRGQRGRPSAPAVRLAAPLAPEVSSQAAQPRQLVKRAAAQCASQCVDLKFASCSRAFAGRAVCGRAAPCG